VAAIGKGAAELIKDHEKAPTAYGKDTPYYDLAMSGGKILLTLSRLVLPTLAFSNAPSNAVRDVSPSDEAAVTKNFLGNGNI
jgi:hypothetical protein